MKILKIFSSIMLILLLCLGAYKYYEHGILYPSTDDAYLKAHVVDVAPQVGGRVVEVLVQSNQYVLKDDVLIRLDPSIYQFAVDEARAAFDLAAKQVGVQRASVVSAQANVERMRAAVEDAQSHAARIQNLLEKGLAGLDAAEHASALAKQASAAYALAQADLTKALEALGSEASAEEENTDSLDNAELRRAAASLAQAQYNLDKTELKAPYSGTLGEVSIRPGSMVRAQQALFPLVEDHDYWIEANFKETDLARIRVGQAVDIELDMFANQALKGEISSISPASGASFSLLPPENATGNWVKVTQRFPVRIRVTQADNEPPLRIGASATVTVDTSSQQ